jgi:membrane-bound lytic murein transglycosylase A
MKKHFIVLFLLFLFSSCARPPVTVTRPEDSLARLSAWQSIAPRDDSEFRDAAVAARQSLEYYKKLPQSTVFFLGPERVSALDMAETLRSFLGIVEDGSLTYDQKVDRIKTDFVFYRSVGSNSSGKVLFTGYYEPLLSCRITRDETFRFPLYRRPDDMIEVDLSQFGNGLPKSRIYGRLDNKKVIPYYSRAEIDQKKALDGKDLELLW